ncbi:MAG: formylglycine-generating enzyme family protein [Verrucomicrobiota bacterium]
MRSFFVLSATVALNFVGISSRVCTSAESVVPFDPDNPPQSELEVVERIREHILATRKIEEEAAMEDYEAIIPKTGVSYSMIAVPSGQVMMGSPASEENRKEDEGPQYTAELGAFWMGKYEVTWDEYEPYMIIPVSRKKDGRLSYPKHAKEFLDFVSSPTTPYTEMSFGMGLEGFPAICMTHHAASKYCQWLSAQTGHFYRLPTEAEWEYACRAGTKSTFWYGNDPERLPEFDVVDPEYTRVGYEKIGTGKPNPWGLYDMHGSVMEWCLDGYVENRLEALQKLSPRNPAKTTFRNPLIPATTRFPRVARGGTWYDKPVDCRSAVRWFSKPDWMIQDPQEPQSLWYLSDAIWLGFRLVRPLEIPSAEEMVRVWNSGEVHHVE